jgi:hypothetical protein
LVRTNDEPIGGAADLFEPSCERLQDLHAVRPPDNSRAGGAGLVLPLEMPHREAGLPACEMRSQAAMDRAPAPSGLAPALASMRGCLDGLHKIGAVREAKIRAGPTVSTL